MLDEETIRAVVARIVAAAHAPAKVILFGSYGRGDAREDSDLDLMVVEREIPDPIQEYARLRHAVGKVGAGVDVLIYPEDEFLRRRDWCSTAVYWAVREGRMMYEQSP